MSPPNLQSALPGRLGARQPVDREEHAATDDLAAPMAAYVGTSGPRIWGIERWLAQRLLRAIGCPPVRLVLWNGEEIAASDAPPVARVVFRDRATFWKVLLDPNLQFGDAYSDGRLEVEGDLVALLGGRLSCPGGGGRAPAACSPRSCCAGCTAPGPIPLPARENIHHHYDIGDDFYKLWLDDEMVYSGAYFRRPGHDAGRRRSGPSSTTCAGSYGCGRAKPWSRWAAAGARLALLMARDYGVTVKSFNISPSQIAYARRRAKDEGLDARVEFIEDDYRNITGRFDALVSLGMLEHVGVRHYREFGRMMNRCLSPTGRGLIQSIGQDRRGRTSPWIERRIFPGAYPPTLREMTDLFEPSGFSILDIENLRLHYAQTLRHWLDALRGVDRGGGRDVRPTVRADVAALFGRLVRGVHQRGAATVPGGFRPARGERDSLDPHGSPRPTNLRSVPGEGPRVRASGRVPNKGRQRVPGTVSAPQLLLRQSAGV